MSRKGAKALRIGRHQQAVILPPGECEPMRISLRLCVFARHPLLPSPDLGLLNCSGHRVELLPLPARPRQPVENYAGHCECAGEKRGGHRLRDHGRRRGLHHAAERVRAGHRGRYGESGTRRRQGLREQRIRLHDHCCAGQGEVEAASLSRCSESPFFGVTQRRKDAKGRRLSVHFLAPLRLCVRLL